MTILNFGAVLISALFILYGCSATKTENVAQNTVATNVPTNIQSSETPNEVAMGAKLEQNITTKSYNDIGTDGKITVDRKQLETDNLTCKKITAFTDEKIANYIKIGVEDVCLSQFKYKLTEDQ